MKVLVYVVSASFSCLIGCIGLRDILGKWFLLLLAVSYRVHRVKRYSGKVDA